LFKYFTSETYTDIELIVNNNKIKCHSIILISRSDYFYERIVVSKHKGPFMFNNIDYNTLKTLIQYLYLDDINFLKEKKKLNQLVELFKITK
jgi:hypothetical protein